MMDDWYTQFQDYGSDPSPANIRAYLAWLGAKNGGLPVFTPKQWVEVYKHFPVERKAELYAAIAAQLVENKVPFPRPPATLSDARDAFLRLRAVPWDNVLSRDASTVYVARQAYRNWLPEHVLGVVGLGAPYNMVSDFFQWPNRLACRGWGSKSPLDLWTPEELPKVDWIFYSFPEDRMRLGVTRDDYVGTFRLRTYTATQFRPQVAKAFFYWLGGGTVLDISCGWGDRLAGFYCSSASAYVGCDPNRAVFEVYQDQCRAYEDWSNVTPTIEHFKIDGYDAFRVRGYKDVTIVNGPAEDIDWSRWSVNTVFASPPYFRVEKYAEDQGPEASAVQSWSRYGEFEAWRDSFLFPVVDRVTASLVPGGVLALNIADPTIGSTRYEACDPLVDRMVDRGMVYEGVVAMALKKRPSTEKGKGAVSTRYAEPVWVLRQPGPALRPIVSGVGDQFEVEDG